MPPDPPREMNPGRQRDPVNTSPKKPADEIEDVEWHWLRPHLDRGALIVVGPALDLAEAAARIAADDTAAVGAWIASGQMAKSTPAQIAAWDAEPLRAFRMLIVQPYVLIQERPATTDEKE
jgi:hypothetical protein